MRVLSLFSGLGGFCEAFVRAGDEVLRIDNNELLNQVPHTTIMTVEELRDNLHLQIQAGFQPLNVDVILAGVPCYEFSMGFHAPRAVASREGTLDEYQPDLDLLDATMDIIRMLKPKFWVIENVIWSQEYFKEYGLDVAQIHDSHVFYGKYPKFATPHMPTKAERDVGPGHPLRANHRGKIPFALSLALRKAITEQRSLFDYHSIKD